MSWDSSYRVISAAEAEQRFSLAGQLHFPYLAPEHQHETRLYEHDWHVEESDLMVGYEREEPPYHVIVDGDLTVDGEFTPVTKGPPTFVLVRGNLSARVVTLGGSPELIVHGDLTSDAGVLGDSTDCPVGRLTVHGHTRGPMVLSLDGFVMDLRHPPEGTAVGEADAFVGTYPVVGVREALRPDLFVDGELSLEGLWDDLSSGGPPPLPAEYERWWTSP
ncbi:hypothetical protein AB0J90_13790 [Micromonospora sp. NPDC049523]|uniref:hypothetical protein n=1 Tax=Micromonospora sp. NPDC049523 TaxID=3155921 RepID=UPI0034485B77